MDRSQTSESLERIAVAAERLLGRDELAPFRNPERPVDALGRQVPRNPFRGRAGTLLFLRLPGAAQQFRTVVPADYRLGPWLLCVCGELQVLEVSEIAGCAGECGRWFLRTETSVRVARWTNGGTE